MPVGEMLERITSAELTEWMAYYRVKAQEEDESRGGPQVWKPPDD